MISVAGLNSMKPGVAKVIGDASRQALDDYRRVGVAPQQVREALQSTFAEKPDSFVCEVQLVGEVYSDTNPVASEAARRGHVVGDPKTLASGYNFLVPTDRARAKAEVARDAPFCLVLAFPCSKWSPLMRLNWGPWMKRHRRDAEVLVNFAVELAELQLKHGRHFIIENPSVSEAWRLCGRLRRLGSRRNKLWARFEQCMLDNRAADGGLHRKGTLILTDCPRWSPDCTVSGVTAATAIPRSSGEFA